jgi:tripartite ATP-independent transporter DctP family solute receptor
MKKILRKEEGMKKLSFILILLIFTLGLALAAGAEDKITIRLGHIRDTNHPTHVAALKFKDRVNEKSGGRIEIKVFPNSQLGAPKEMFAQMQTGDLEMVYGGINTFAWIKGGEPYEITAIPFLFRDYAHMSKVLLSDFFKPVQEKAEQETGIKIVTINGDTAPRGLSTRDKPVYKADDFKGLKIRTAASPTVLTAMKTLGALPQQVPFSELYMALKTGIVDAQEKAGNYETELTQKQLTTVYDSLKTKMTVITPPQLDLDSIRKKLEGAFDSFEGMKWPAGLLKKVGALK